MKLGSFRPRFRKCNYIIKIKVTAEISKINEKNKSFAKKSLNAFITDNELGIFPAEC
jgi:hypothetical protein